MTTTTNLEDLLENLGTTAELAAKIQSARTGLPSEFQEKADAKMVELSSMSELVMNFAKLEVERLEALQRITLSQMQTRGNA